MTLALADLLYERGIATELGSVCELINGRAFKVSEWNKDEGLPIIRIQNLRANESFYNYYAGEISDRHIVEPGDLLFAWSGTPGTSFGPHVWNGPKGALNQHIFKLKITTSELSRDFLYWWLRASTVGLISKARGGAGLQHLRKRDIESLPVVVPTRKRQAIFATRLAQLEQAVALGRVAEAKVLQETSSLELDAARRLFTGKLGTTDLSDKPLALAAPAGRKVARKRGPRTALRSHGTLRQAMMDALDSSAEPLTPTTWFAETKERFDVGAIEFNQVLMDLVQEKAIDIVRPVQPPDTIRYWKIS